jgi:hypothetical protein
MRKDIKENSKAKENIKKWLEFVEKNRDIFEKIAKKLK